MGFIEGQNLAIEYVPDAGYDRLPEFAAAFVRRKVAVIATGNNVGALAAKAATSDIPVVRCSPMKPGATFPTRRSIPNV